MRKEFAKDTYLDLDNTYLDTVSGRALCSDGKVRKLKRVGMADTFFSMPAAVSVKGKTVTGFITTCTEQGFSTESDTDRTVVYFHANLYGKNANLLPRSTEG